MQWRHDRIISFSCYIFKRAANHYCEIAALASIATSASVNKIRLGDNNARVTIFRLYVFNFIANRVFAIDATLCARAHGGQLCLYFAKGPVAWPVSLRKEYFRTFHLFCVCTARVYLKLVLPQAFGGNLVETGVAEINHVRASLDDSGYAWQHSLEFLSSLLVVFGNRSSGSFQVELRKLLHQFFRFIRSRYFFPNSSVS